jgi:hypothetical protein
VEERDNKWRIEIQGEVRYFSWRIEIMVEERDTGGGGILVEEGYLWRSEVQVGGGGGERP